MFSFFTKASQHALPPKMDEEEDIVALMKKVSALELKSRKLTNHMFRGEYHSAFKGKGMHFREVREYAAGDDPRFIDWNVSARFSHPFTKLFEEERELTTILLIDISASQFLGSKQQSKKALMTEVAAVLCFSAISNQDKVGAIFFSDRVEKYIPPRKGKQHALYIVRQMLSIRSSKRGTSLNEAIRYYNNTCRQRSIAFLLSDFQDKDFDKDLKVIARKHDVIGIKIYDALDMNLPSAGLLAVADAETGQESYIDSHDPWVRKQYQQQFLQQAEACRQWFVQAGSELLHIRTDEDYVKILQQFFLRRA